MTNESIEEEYPHWRTALFGNHNAVANLRCAIEYVFWHAIYATIAVGGMVIVRAIKVGKFLAKLFGPIGRPIDRGLDRGIAKVNNVANHKYVENAVGILMILSVLYLVVVFAYIAYTHIMFAITIVGTIVLMVAIAILLMLITSYIRDPAANAANKAAAKASEVGEKATQTPGVRRVYGECPVTLSQSPKWFDNLFPEDDL